MVFGQMLLSANDSKHSDGFSLSATSLHLTPERHQGAPVEVRRCNVMEHQTEAVESSSGSLDRGGASPAPQCGETV